MPQPHPEDARRRVPRTDLVLSDDHLDPDSAAEAALMADTPPAQIRDRDLPEDTR